MNFSGNAVVLPLSGSRGGICRTVERVFIEIWRFWVVLEGGKVVRAWGGMLEGWALHLTKLSVVGNF